VTSPPTIDGDLNLTEWPGAPLITFASDSIAGNEVQVYFVRDTANLYLAFIVDDVNSDADDAIRLFFDTNGNEGDPDGPDRFFLLQRNNLSQLQSGIGSNSDNAGWDNTYASTDWQAQAGEAGVNQWVVELRIDANAEMGTLSNPFGMMLTALFTNDQVSWPENATFDTLNTYQKVNNVVCSQP
jgi:hypothetical protein